MPVTLTDADREHAAQIVALFSVLVHAWLTSEFHEAGRVSADLERLGVTVKLRRPARQAVARA